MSLSRACLHARRRWAIQFLRAQGTHPGGNEPVEGTLDHAVVGGEGQAEVAGHLDDAAGQDVHLLVRKESCEGPVVRDGGPRQKVERAFRDVDAIAGGSERADQTIPALAEAAEVMQSCSRCGRACCITASGNQAPLAT